MSAPVNQPEFILIVNQENKDAIAALLPGIGFAQVLAYDIGVVDRIILSVPRAAAPVPAPESIPVPEALEKAIEEAIELPVEDMDVPAAE